MGDDWKQVHANAAEKALDHALVQDVIREQLGNLGYPEDSRGLASVLGRTPAFVHRRSVSS